MDARRSPQFDALSLPLVGRFLRWKHSRLAVQVPLLLLAAALVLHGLLGPELAPKNLATLLVWVHWRGLLVLALLFAGNLFCFGCPLLVPRELARRIRAPKRAFPRALRRKWLGVGLFVGVLFVYEWLDLWASPAATAWAIVTYFAAALVIDACFKGAPFCKWVCPIGQFNFIASTFSPLEVRAKDLGTCSACATKDCIRGQRLPGPNLAKVAQRGCELALFLPEKVGNLDCTFCLDCVHACPADNVVIGARVPAEELAVDPVRSGIGRVSKRPDIAALAVVFTFGALLNAFAMVSPVYAFQRQIAAALGTSNEALVLAVLFALSLLVAPAVLVGGAALATRALTGVAAGNHAQRFALSLAPLGFGVWLAHYCFHFLTGLWTFVPVTQSAARDVGLTFLGAPRWGLGGLREALVWPLEVGFVAVGLIGALGVTWRLAARDFGAAPIRAFVPWAALHATLAGAALWLLAQPMEMRGTFL
ncbi:MAG: FesM [Planctomycetota bacterium]